MKEKAKLAEDSELNILKEQSDQRQNGSIESDSAARARGVANSLVGDDKSLCSEGRVNRPPLTTEQTLIAQNNDAYTIEVKDSSHGVKEDQDQDLYAQSSRYSVMSPKTLLLTLKKLQPAVNILAPNLKRGSRNEDGTRRIKNKKCRAGDDNDLYSNAITEEDFATFQKVLNCLVIRLEELTGQDMITSP